MTIPWTLLAIVAVYSLAVLAVALLVEGRESWRRRAAQSPVVYALSLAVFSTAWSYYGSVELAASSGYMFMSVCLGVVLSAILWWPVLRKIVQVKSSLRITSLADFVSARYGRSQFVAVVVTLGALVGSLPYVALQMKAILSTLAVAAGVPAGIEPLWMGAAGPGLVLFMAVFTILVGVRRLDPTERHQGIIFAVALESVVKLVAILAVGLFVTYGLFDGLDDVFTRVAAMPDRPVTGLGGATGRAYMNWMSLLLLSACAVLFLPRQFHVAAVENSDERHIYTAMWLFPLYYLLMNLFVFPIAMGGLLSGLPASEAATFVLRLPYMAGHDWLGILVFLGGFSAGMSMIVISAMTMATMITNHIVLPLANNMPSLGGLRRWILQCRWVVVTVYLGLGYAFYRMLGDSSLLVSMGVISFGATMQFVPALIGGLYWTRGNRAGALAGMFVGFAVWGYTLLVPSIVRAGWLPVGLLEAGPFGLDWLRPEALFGMTALEPLSHSVFWSMVGNVGAYLVGSVIMETSEEDDASAGLFVHPLGIRRPAGVGSGTWEPHISLQEKQGRLAQLFGAYYPLSRGEELAQECVGAAGLAGVGKMTIHQLMALYAEAERLLSGVIGSAAAYRAMRQGDLYSVRETMELSEVYAGILTGLKVSPEDLAQRIDYYKEREVLLARHSEELEEANRLLREEVEERRRTQESLHQAEQKYRGIFENAVEGIFQTTPEGGVLDLNPAALRFFEYPDVETARRVVNQVARQVYENPQDRERFLALLKENGTVSGFETRLRNASGVARWVDLSARGIFRADGSLAAIEGFLQDIDKRKQAEEDLARANRSIKNIVESMPSAMIAVDGEGRITLTNQAAGKVLGRTSEQARGVLIGEAYPSLEGAGVAVRRAVAEQRPISLGRRSRMADNAVRYEDVMVYPLGAGGAEEAVVRVDDVTERVLMEEMMIQTEKMMSVGGLAAGMAHEINNPLGGILQAVQNIERRVLGDLPANRTAAQEVSCSLDHVQEYFRRRGIDTMLTGIRESGERAATIVRNMLEFSRRSDASRTGVDVEALLDKTLGLASNDYDLKKNYDFRNIRIVRRYETRGARIWCVQEEIEQVLLNLLKNAAQAMALQEQPPQDPCITLITSVEGGLVRIEVRDNGPGMDQATRRRVFEPFFTTKAAGIGTGLGLSVSFFIISKHGGRMAVESEPGKGTAFIIQLPAHNPDAATQG